MNLTLTALAPMLVPCIVVAALAIELFWQLRRHRADRSPGRASQRQRHPPQAPTTDAHAHAPARPVLKRPARALIGPAGRRWQDTLPMGTADAVVARRDSRRA